MISRAVRTGQQCPTPENKYKEIIFLLVLNTWLFLRVDRKGQKDATVLYSGVVMFSCIFQVLWSILFCPSCKHSQQLRFHIWVMSHTLYASSALFIQFHFLHTEPQPKSFFPTGISKVQISTNKDTQKIIYPRSYFHIPTEFIFIITRKWASSKQEYAFHILSGTDVMVSVTIPVVHSEVSLLYLVNGGV